MNAIREVAVLGFGHQGEAQALNLRDAGVRVVVGARPGRAAEARAREAGFETRSPDAAVRDADVVAMLLPDEAMAEAWPALAAAAGRTPSLVFAHGFALLYADLALERFGDVVVVSPTAPGRVLRATRAAGGTLPGYLAVHRDRSGDASALGREYAAAIGIAPLVTTSVREETEVDLFGEQVVLCGGLQSLVAAAFETLVARGFTPEVAYLECVHQLKYLADLLHEKGPAEFRGGISGTALYGDLTRGPRVIGAESRAEMARILDEIRSGRFAAEWRDEVRKGKPVTRAALAAAEAHPIERARRRALGIPDADPAR